MWSRERQPHQWLQEAPNQPRESMPLDPFSWHVLYVTLTHNQHLKEHGSYHLNKEINLCKSPQLTPFVPSSPSTTQSTRV